MNANVGIWRIGTRTMQTRSEENEFIKPGSAESFAKLVDTYQNRVFGFVRRMVPTGEDAEDITQEVFIRAFQSFDRYDARASVRTWLFRIAYNLCVDRARKSNRGLQQVSLQLSPDIEEEIDVPDTRWQPDVLLEDSEFRGRLDKAIGSMSEKLRSVLLLHDKEDLSYDEIASALNIPIGTVKSRLFLARTQLQNAVKDLVEN